MFFHWFYELCTKGAFYTSTVILQVILASRSEYFRALLFGGMRETNQQEVELVDTPLPAFKHLLR